MRYRALAAMAVVFALSGSAENVTGTIKFEGTPPTMKTYENELKTDPVCAAHKRDKPLANEALVLGEGQTMANVLVEISGGLPEKEYKAPAEPVVVTQEGCQYSPHIVVVQAGQPLKVLNPDGTMHNVNGTPKVNAPFNFGMPKDVKEKTITFDKPEPMFPMACSVHPWMRAYCTVVSNPYYAVTGPDGKFTIKDLPPGDYEVRAIHERLGTQTAKVTVAAGKDGVTDFSFSIPKK